jgi:hypothetical protein
MIRYTLEEIVKINPSGFMRYMPYPLNIVESKLPITHISEFSEQDMSVFLAIVKEICNINPDQTDLKVWAAGSRVNGKWRTRVESEALYSKGYMLKYSDYDVLTNAKKLPEQNNLKNIMRKFGEIAHVVFCEESDIRQHAIQLPTKHTIVDCVSDWC